MALRSCTEISLDGSARLAIIAACLVNARPVDPITHYIIVRGDLPLGVAAAQIAHAAGESSPGNLKPGTFAVVLAARDAAHLAQVADRLRIANVNYVAVFESDAPYTDQLMSIGVAPGPRSTLRQHLSSLSLYGRIAQ